MIREKYHNCQQCGVTLEKPDRKRKFCSPECRKLGIRVMKIIEHKEFNGECNCGICQNERYNTIIEQVARYFFEIGIQEAIRDDGHVLFKHYWKLFNEKAKI